MTQHISVGRLRSVQVVRAIAALGVVFMHSTHLWVDKFGKPGAFEWSNGTAGVDLFFVVSGFIMIVSSQALQVPGVDRPGLQFLEARVIRLVPLYWLATTLKLIMLVAVPAGVVLDGHPTLIRTICSYLFIPSRSESGKLFPIVAVGWTLSFEMLFYVLFACCLAARLKPLRFLIPALILLSLAGLGQTGNGPALASLLSPMLIEFVFGMLLGSLFLTEPPNGSPALLVPLMLAAFVWLVIAPMGNPWERMAVFGIPATVALGCAVAMEKLFRHRAFDFPVFLGEASYSLYLVHTFLLPIVGVAAKRLHLNTPEGGMFIIFAVVTGSVTAALLCYRYVEVPMTKFLRSVLHVRQVKRAFVV